MQNKETIATAIAENHSISKKEARKIVGEIFDGIIAETAREDGKVTILGFGTFTATKHKARECRNIQTGEKISVPEKFAPHFKAGAEFKKALAK